ncbi:MAG TPA: hypothetical protein VMX33_13595 [bacterium]|nr:hypothetical protein [bacterium]
MEELLSGDSYRIRSCRWNDFTKLGRKVFTELLKTNEEGASAFFGIYFNKYDVIHKLGHILRTECGLNNREMQKGAEEEYFANLFAIKYFQYKNEEIFLEDIEKWIDYLLSKYNVGLKNDVMRLNKLFERYALDLRTYAALHFVSIKDSLENGRTFEEMVYLLSGGKIKSINRSIIMQKGINGMSLVNECLAVLFGMTTDVPEVEIEYLTELTIGKYEKIDKKRRTIAST